MSASMTINAQEIRQISQPHTVSQSRLRLIAQKAEALATAVENKWEDFSDVERDLLKALIYTSIIHQDGNQGFWASLRTRLSLAWMLICGETDVLADYFRALIRLKNAVLGAIEKEHPDYEQTMAEVVQETLAKSGLPAMTPDEFCEWLSSVSD
ncbi:MAG: hypothetical protein HC789_10655 [Microcoleus sp. CSU_2_2]|nr:hypothetical protein [Microcoleus sp. SU_5_3]NJS10787.1 hypothetical protein [Microcoleus sp. CSU_2_2]